jgi:hypothetical protein
MEVPAAPLVTPLSPPGEGDVEHVYLGAEAIEGAPMTTQQVRVDGVDIAYTDTGPVRPSCSFSTGFEMV